MRWLRYLKKILKLSYFHDISFKCFLTIQNVLTYCASPAQPSLDEPGPRTHPQLWGLSAAATSGLWYCSVLSTCTAQSDWWKKSANSVCRRLPDWLSGVHHWIAMIRGQGEERQTCRWAGPSGQRWRLLRRHNQRTSSWPQGCPDHLEQIRHYAYELLIQRNIWR